MYDSETKKAIQMYSQRYRLFWAVRVKAKQDESTPSRDHPATNILLHLRMLKLIKTHTADDQINKQVLAPSSEPVILKVDFSLANEDFGAPSIIQ
ncbi:uncharacterized protein PHALS_15077 [Plasmopara halstedii]|uniref:Uncharacterized protein n=1 Tax=Plasmopara halstedii TaxID=4781 RepID=A0A0P1B387_PLAHL|nr:uncharacterized protein PHALS_15077 [Plasmopara halstedii]CEG47837.1 hypothetical protein PHALS_15077 [Plasmopara halstedii]|eukprot:XP_024584206.1 hypothetical protein PHALS_15077 [Plasmopara halstedii]